MSVAISRNPAALPSNGVRQLVDKGSGSVDERELPQGDHSPVFDDVVERAG